MRIMITNQTTAPAAAASMHGVRRRPPHAFTVERRVRRALRRPGGRR